MPARKDLLSYQQRNPTCLLQPGRIIQGQGDKPMEENSSRIRVSQEGNVTIVELTDSKILDEASIAKIGEELDEIVKQSEGKIRLVLDFINVRHMSSSTLSMLITLQKHVAERNGLLVLCNIHPQIFQAFKITRLNEVFNICPDQAQAVSEASA